MRLRPLGEYIIIKRIDPEETTEGGIVLPEAARNGTDQGRVLSVGEGRRLADGTRVALQVNEGDRIVFRSYAGTDVELGGEKVRIVREDDVLAILR